MLVCPACGRRNPDDGRFCSACGTALPAEPPAREERKVVSVLFADLVGFTARAERMDAEAVRELLRPYHARLRAELERRGGTVEKFIGDAVMAVFGAPAAHEDDAERAVRAALAIRDAAAEDDGQHVRIAITTGEALVVLSARPERGEGIVAGDVVNTAARLQAAAPEDGILVDEETFRRTERAIAYREHEPVVAKGKSRPVPVWEAVEARARVGADARRVERAPLVGREAELETLVAALERVRERREPELVTVVGVPGIGKSRLVWELSRRVDAAPDLVTWRQGHSLPYGAGVSFWALSEMVKAQAGILDTDAPEAAGAKLREALGSLPLDDRAWVESHLGVLLGLGAAAGADGGGGSEAEAFAAWRRFFEALAGQRPTVLVFEDLHWADDGLLDFVDHLLGWAGGSPLLVVCTARPELFARRSDWGAGRANAHTVALAPLSAGESERLVRALGAGEAPAPELLRLVLERAGGNPLYAEEFARLAAEGALREDAPLPASVHGIIAARLDTLPPDEKSLLQDAAVLGRAFWTGGVGAIAGIARWSAEDLLHRLERKEFIRRERRSSVATETEYVFRHVLVRDVAYGQVPRAERAQKHRVAAEWLESLSLDRAEKAEMLAHHYVAALGFAREARQETAELARRARRALGEAGERAAALHAWPAAARFYQQALDLEPPDEERARLRFGHGRALFRAEGAGRAVLAQALGELLASGDRARAAEAELLLGELDFREGERAAAFEHFGRALGLVEDEEPSRAKAHVLSTLSRFHTVALEPHDAIRYGRRALAMAAELGLREVEAHALNNVGVARVALGDAGGIQDLERSVAAAVEINSPESVRAYLNLGTNVAHLGDLRRTFEVHAEGRRAAERFGDAAGIQWFAAERLWELYWRGDWDAAASGAEELLAAVEAGSPRAHFEPSARLVRGWIALGRGPLAQALDEVTALCGFAREARFLQALLPALALRARLLAGAGAAEEAAAQAEEALTAARESGVGASSFWTADVAFALERAGRSAGVAEALAALPRTRWTDAAVAVARGDLVRAAAIFGEIGSVPDEAVARLRTGVAAEIERALAFFRRAGAARYVEEGQELVAAGP